MTIKIIAVFGSAWLTQAERLYDDTLTIGRLLAESGYSVMTGGYGGAMGAASEGAASANGHVIGVTVKRQIGDTNERVANRWVKQEIQYDTMRQRLHHLVDEADGYIAVPGGIGTLQEIADAWQRLRLHDAPPRPLICYGAYWRQILEPLAASTYVPDHHAALLQFADTPQQAVDLLTQWFAQNV